VRLSDGNRSDDPLGRLADAWNDEKQRALEARATRAIADCATDHVKRPWLRADGTRGPSCARKRFGHLDEAYRCQQSEPLKTREGQ
jgi:hypothetical protein